MQNQAEILFFLILLYWLANGLVLYRGFVFKTRRLMASKDALPAHAYPKVSIIVAARDEAANLPAAISSFAAQNYPDFEVLAVDDRSTDGSRRILQELALKHPNVKVLSVDTLPQGWLGKTHGLFTGYEASRGQWLLFTDADVILSPQALKNAMDRVLEEGWDHLTLFPRLEAEHYVESAFSNYFAIAFNTRYQPWAASDPKSRAYVGIGAFNLVRREIYEKAGAHRRLALDVADDMAVGKIMKEAGGRSIGMYGQEFVRVRWVVGFRGVMNALHKNGFRGVNYNVFFLVAASMGLTIVDVAPFVGAAFAAGRAQWLAAVSVVILFILYFAGNHRYPGKHFTFWTHPLTAALFIFILWRSAFSAIFRGGVSWRNTRYPLKDLKKGMV